MRFILPGHGGAITMQISKKPYMISILCVFIIATGALCSKEPSAPMSTIATSIAPIADIAQNIAGNVFIIISAIPPNANPHTFEADPSTVKLLQSSSLFIGVHPEFDGWVSKMVSPAGKKFFLSDIIKGDNPHLWLSVKNAKRIAAAIRDFLSSSYPERAGQFTENCDAYQKKLDNLDKRISTMFSSIEQKKVFQWHPAWDYFANDYGLIIAGTFESGHGDSPSIKGIADLKKRALKENIKVVIIDYYAHNTTAEAFVREIGGKAVRLDGIGNPNESARAHYLSLMEYNARTLAKALSE